MDKCAVSAFSDQDDLTLIAKYREGDELACTALLVRYANLINHWVSRIEIGGVDRDDLRQEAYMGLLSAIRSYQPGRNASFRTYASACIANCMKNQFATASTQKARFYRAVLPIDDTEEKQIPNRMNPEDIFIDGESCAEMQRLFHKHLSNFERNALFGYLSGESYAQIATRLHSSPKSVDNALQRARRKLKAVLNSFLFP
jgi:RNA polymerase sporulation-specific sigma factor